jgi:raffinose/stachyose/melibiose transport system substrate-binding protein
MMTNDFPQGLSRRDLLRLFGAAGLGTLAVACAGPGAGGPKGGGAPAPGEVKGALSFAHWRAEDKAVFDKIISDFVGAHAGVTVRQDISPSNDYQSTALQRIKGGAIGDVFTAFRGAQFVNMVKAGLYSDLSGQTFVTNYDERLVSAGQDGGKQWGLPYQLVFNTPLANLDLLEKTGFAELPKDWDGFLAMCQQLKGKGIIPIAFPGGDPGNAGQLLNCMVMNNAPADDMFAKIESGELKATDDWYVKTLEQYAQLRPYFQPNAVGTAVEPAQQIFASQKAAFLATGSFHISAVRQLGAKFPIDLYAPITVPADQVKYQGVHNATFILGVSTASKNQATALEFVKALSDPKTATAYANGTAQHVTVKGVEYTDPDLKALEPWLSKPTLLAPRFQFNDLDIRAAVENAAVEVIAGKSPQAAAAAAQRIVDQKRK